MRSFIVLLVCAASTWGQTSQPLRLEKTIEMPDVQGRIDHMSVDVKGGRLFVSALGNNTVEVIDTKAGKRIKTITGLQEPQGVLYVPAVDRLYVANGKDGSVRIFDGSSYAPLKTLDFGDDADNLRYDSDRKRIYVGYGGGALAEIDEEGNKTGEIKLDAHPESFQLEKDNPRTYVNLPKSRKVAVLDREARAVISTWSLGMTLANYPMALDQPDHRLFVVTRYPARFLVFDTTTGKTVQRLPVVGDCDDVFYDKASKRIYAIGGEGAISVFEQRDPDHYKESVRITTVKGARTGFFSPELDGLFLAVRRQGTQPAAVAAAYAATRFNNIMDMLQLVFAFVNAPLFATFLLGMFWKRATGHGAFLGLISGTTAAAIHHGLTLPEGAAPGIKGGWLGSVLHFYPSEMAQNFWTAIWAWTTCFVVTIAISLLTRQRDEKELVGLVYSMTERPSEEHLPWYKRPIALGLAVIVLTLMLNLIFY